MAYSRITSFFYFIILILGLYLFFGSRTFLVPGTGREVNTSLAILLWSFVFVSITVEKEKHNN